MDNRPDTRAEATAPQMRKNAPAIILVRPQMGENIGAAARVMANFGLSDLRIAAPRDGWPNAKADAMAAGGIGVVQAATVVRTAAEAVGDLTMTFATTARRRELEKPVFSPREAMAAAKAEIARGGRPGFVFGPEASGLSNDEVAGAAAIVSIPVDPACSSLNLAQAVAIVAYEWRAGDAVDGFPAPGERATLGEIEGLTRQLEAALDGVGYFFPPHKADTMRLNVRSMFARGDFTQNEVQSLRGALKALVERPKKR